MPQIPDQQDHADLLSLFRETHQMSGLTESGIADLIDFAEILYRENKHLRSQIETDSEYRTELEVQLLSARIDLYNERAINGE
ncbi:Hypothetical Protein OBI_RACECAR_51 [Arthrobacter phage Racecar]|nr:hypothetical protein PBI_RACECAR_133 [Arthrobacter phage Racecar]QFG12807.1 hypothetical protein PBI_MIMI_130 [Arthrobacter phage Mimi]